MSELATSQKNKQRINFVASMIALLEMLTPTKGNKRVGFRDATLSMGKERLDRASCAKMF